MVAIGQCQCMPTCRLPPLKGLPFCKKHMNYCPRKAPLTGSEPKYNPKRYNKTRRIRESHNCFAYAFNHMDIPPKSECNEQRCTTPFHQPGRKSGFPKWGKVKGKRCPDLLARLFADVPGLKRTTFTRKCPKGSYKVLPVTDYNNDYHFYQQNSDGIWSHKPGATAVTRLDATGRLIYDPSLASRDYRDKGSDLNYKYACDFVCVPRRKHTFKRGGKHNRVSSKKRDHLPH